MLVFVDESGDSGMKGKEGSSALFVITAVLFEENECQGRSKTSPVRRSKSRPVDWDEVVEYFVGKGLWSVAEEDRSRR